MSGDAAQRIATLEGLVRWLALPYAGNEPVFAGADGLGRDEGPSLEAAALRDLYREVVGAGEPPGEGAYWWRCEACGMWQLLRELPPESLQSADNAGTM